MYRAPNQSRRFRKAARSHLSAGSLGLAPKDRCPARYENRQGIWKVRMPWPKWLTAGTPVPGSPKTLTEPMSMPPFQRAMKPRPQRISQPWALAIGKTISRRVHPAALYRSRTDVQFVSFQNIGGEFHAIHIWQNIPEVSDRSCLSERLPYTVTRRTCEVCSRQGSPILCPRAACLSVPV